MKLFCRVHELILVLKQNYTLALVENKINYALPVSQNQHLPDFGQGKRNQFGKRLYSDLLIDFSNRDQLLIDKASLKEFFEVRMFGLQLGDKLEALFEGTDTEFEEHKVPKFPGMGRGIFKNSL